MSKIFHIGRLMGAVLLAGSVCAHAADTTTTDSPAATPGTSTAPAGTSPTPAASATAAPATAATPAAPAPGASASADKARDALATKEGDVTSEKNLQEVFQSSEKQYSLLKSGEMSLDYSLSYSYYRADRIDIAFNDSGAINRFLIEQDAQHSFVNAFSFNYGVWNNLTANVSLPLIYKYDSTKNLSGAALGDVSFGLRWQPFALKRGAPVTTLFATVSAPTGDSPYKINPNTDLSSGSGFYGAGGGASVSKVLDPAVVFGSVSYTMGFDVTGLDQARSSRVLNEVRPGDAIGFSMGLAYSLSYDLSISCSYSQTYAFQSQYLFSDGSVVGSQDSTSASFSTSLGVRMSPQRIVNVGFGFGLTPEAPNVSLSLSMPIDIAGLKK